MSLDFENMDDFDPEKTQSFELEEYGVWVKKETPEITEDFSCSSDIFNTDIFNETVDTENEEIQAQDSTQNLENQELPDFQDFITDDKTEFPIDIEDNTEKNIENSELVIEENKVEENFETIQNEIDSIIPDDFKEHFTIEDFGEGSDYVEAPPETLADFIKENNIQRIKTDNLDENPICSEEETISQNQEILESNEPKLPDLSSEIGFDIPDFSNISEEIDLDAFLSDFEASAEASAPAPKPSSSSSNSGITEEVSLDDFGLSEFVSLDDFITPTEEKNDIIGDEPLDIQLTFDDSYALATGANPLEEMETDFTGGVLPSGDDFLDNFDDIFENVTDISEPQTETKAPTPVTEDFAFDSVSEFDDLLASLSDLPPSTENIVDKKKQNTETYIYDISVNIEEDDIIETTTAEVDDNEEDFNVSLFSDEDLDNNSLEQNNSISDNTVEVLHMSNDNDSIFSIDDLDDSISFVDETPMAFEGIPVIDESNTESMEESKDDENYSPSVSDFPIETTFIDNPFAEEPVQEEPAIEVSSFAMDESFTEDQTQGEPVFEVSPFSMDNDIDTNEISFAIDESFVDEPTFDENPAIEETPEEDTPFAMDESFVEEPTFDENPIVEETLAEDNSFVMDESFTEEPTFDENPIVEETLAEDTPFTMDESFVEEPTFDENPAIEEALAEDTSFVMDESFTEEPTFDENPITEEALTEDNSFAMDESFVEEPTFDENQIVEETLSEDNSFAMDESFVEEPTFDENPIVEETLSEDTSFVMDETFTEEPTFDENPIIEEALTEDNSFVMNESFMEEPTFDENPITEEALTEDNSFAMDESFTEEPTFDENPITEEALSEDNSFTMDESFVEEPTFDENPITEEALSEDNSFAMDESFTEEPTFDENPITEEALSEDTSFVMDESFVEEPTFDENPAIEETLTEDTSFAMNESFTEEPTFDENPIIEETLAEDSSFTMDETFTEEPTFDENQIVEEALTEDNSFAMDESFVEEPTFDENQIVEEALAEDTSFAMDETFTEEPTFDENPAIEEALSEDTSFAMDESFVEEPTFDENQIPENDPFAIDVEQEVNESFLDKEVSEEDTVFTITGNMTEETISPLTTNNFAADEIVSNENPVIDENITEEDPFAVDVEQEVNESFLDEDVAESEKDFNIEESLPTVASITAAAVLAGAAIVASEDETSELINNVINPTEEVLPEEAKEEVAEPTVEENSGINDMSNTLLEKIVNELTQLRAEMASIKEELNTIKTNPEEAENQIEEEIVAPSENESTGFFSDEEDDETIALSGDELNNILNTADFSESAENIQQSEDLATDESPLTAEENSPSDKIEETIEETETNTEEATISEETLTINEEIDISVPSEEDMDENIQPSDDLTIDESVLDNLDNTIQIDEEIVNSPLESEIVIENDIEEEIQPEAELSISDDDFYAGEEDTPTLSIKEQEIVEPKVDNISLDFDDDMENVPENLPDELDTESFVIDSSSTDFLEENVSNSKNTELEVNNQENDFEETLETDELESDEVIEFEEHSIDAANLNLKSDDEILAALDEDDDINDEPVEEVFNSQWDSFEKSTDTTEENNPISITLAELENARLQAEKQEDVSIPVQEPVKEAALPDNLKNDVKEVLNYMDKLLEELPDEKISEFAKSEHFEVYKRLFTELGL